MSAARPAPTRTQRLAALVAAGLVSCAPHVAPSGPVPPTGGPAPDDAARVAYARAVLAASLGDLEARDRSISWLARLDTSAWTQAAAGRLLLEAGDLIAAAGPLERAAAALPADAAAQRALGDLRAAQGRLAEARERWVMAARLGDDDAWVRALEGAPPDVVRAVVLAWEVASIPDRQRAARASAASAAGRDDLASSDWAVAMGWVASPSGLAAWAGAAGRDGCRLDGLAAWMARHDPAALGRGWAEAWTEACAVLDRCEAFDDARECLGPALEVTAPEP